MKKSLKFLFIAAAFAAMFSSCKKTPTSLAILTGHKWVLQSATATYSDSTGKTKNLMPKDTVCTTSSYTEFQNYGSGSELRLAYEHTTSNCAGYYTPEVSVTSWDMSPDNSTLYLYGSPTNGTGGVWFTIQTLSASQMVLVLVSDDQIGTTGYPNYTPIYHVVTATYTYGVK